jgi:hypothetical protein
MLTAPRLVLFVALAMAVLAAPARAEGTAWDQPKVTALAKQLVDATSELYDTFYKQPPPTTGSMQSRAYHRLKQQVRRIRTEARALSKALAGGAGFEETLPNYEELMQVVRVARQEVQGVFTTTAVQEKASAVRAVLNQLTPYYDPDAKPLAPATR